MHLSFLVISGATICNLSVRNSIRHITLHIHFSFTNFLIKPHHVDEMMIIFIKDGCNYKWMAERKVEESVGGHDTRGANEDGKCRLIPRSQDVYCFNHYRWQSVQIEKENGREEKGGGGGPEEVEEEREKNLTDRQTYVPRKTRLHMIIIICQ